MVTDEIAGDVRTRLALRLDVADGDSAIRLARDLAPWFGVAKVGMDLLVGAGPGIVANLRSEGFDVFCDFKLHDIPDQVAASARAIGRLGVRYATMHAAGGSGMLAAGVAGLAEGASEVGFEPPIALGVTVLTSDSDTGAFPQRLEWAVKGGCGGVVCSAHEAAGVKLAHPELVVVTPGIRLESGEGHDQSRVSTPHGAIASGADVLVIGRAVIDAPDPHTAARLIANEVADAIPV